MPSRISAAALAQVVASGGVLAATAICRDGSKKKVVFKNVPVKADGTWGKNQGQNSVGGYVEKATEVQGSIVIKKCGSDTSEYRAYLVAKP